MGFNLIPREEKFFDLLENTAQNVHQTAVVFKAVVSDWRLDHPYVRQIRDLEHDCDSLTHDIFDKLNRTFVTPLDREDIYKLAAELDDIVDLINSVASRLNLYKVSKTAPELIEQANILEQAVATVLKAVQSLRDMKNTRRILDYCIEVDRLENEGDKIMEIALSNLFSNNHDPLEVIKWKEIHEVAETGIDKCEDVTNTIESIIVKYS
ncbi:MAG: DUF47 domain-containing protein [Elusimicrobia bacterium]|nr:DUF47 domain-containing protein [Elusimicrobiota bacterium]